MNIIGLINEYAKHHTPVFELDESEPQDMIFCGGMWCKECEVKILCQNTTWDSINSDDIDLIKAEYPEFFI